MKEKHELQRSYDQIAAQYAAAFFNELDQKPFDRRLLDRFAERVGQRGQVWDVGCGPGHVASYLHARESLSAGWTFRRHLSHEIGGMTIQASMTHQASLNGERIAHARFSASHL